MSIYSIKDLEHLSGIKAHTIRIWELRHNLFSPQRTETNIRFYNDEDLRLILNISLLKNHGMKISKIVRMNAAQMKEEVVRLHDSEYLNEDQINTLTVAMIEMDEHLVNSVISTNREKIGFERTVSEIIYPFFKKIGILWMSNSIHPAQEHFISHLIRGKIIAETEKIQMDPDAESFLLFLPEDELHEIGLLFANYLLRSRGYKTTYLGQSVPLKDLEAVYHMLHPDYLFTILTSGHKNLKVLVGELGKKFKESKVFVTGTQVSDSSLSFPRNIHILTQIDDLDPALTEHQAS